MNESFPGADRDPRLRRRPATMNLAGLPAGLLRARIEHGYGKNKLAS